LVEIIHISKQAHISKTPKRDFGVFDGALAPAIFLPKKKSKIKIKNKKKKQSF
jgi:hypothetical protein